MAKRWLTIALVLVLMTCSGSLVLASNEELDPLLKLLVDQGVITLEQALEVQAQAKALEDEADKQQQQQVITTETFEQPIREENEAAIQQQQQVITTETFEQPIREENEAAKQQQQQVITTETFEQPIREENEAAKQQQQQVITTETFEQPIREENEAPMIAEEKGFELPKVLLGAKIGTLAYLSYQDGDDASRFTLKRGYINIKKKVTPYLEVRITPDAHQDSSGDFKLRLKYLYAKFKWHGGGIINKPYVEFGLAHMPWLDFEEHINRFRMQDTMFMERNGLFNSADAGLMFGANLGPELPDEYSKTVNDHYAGRYGSFQVGIFNGGGYHAKEHNSNKVIEGRLTLRPLPDTLPGLQFSLFGLSGEGNQATNPPDWEVLAAMVSYESRNFVATVQYYDGKGNQKGTAVDSEGRALDQDGFSLFAEIRCPQHQNYSLFARHDRFDTDATNPNSVIKKRSIIGLAWQFYKGNYWVLDYDRIERSRSGLPAEDRIQLTLQLKY